MVRLPVDSHCWRSRRRRRHHNVISYECHKENSICLRSMLDTLQHLHGGLPGHRDWRRGKRLVVLRRTGVPTRRFDIWTGLLRWQTENVSQKINETQTKFRAHRLVGSIFFRTFAHDSARGYKLKNDNNSIRYSRIWEFCLIFAPKIRHRRWK